MRVMKLRKYPPKLHTHWAFAPAILKSKMPNKYAIDNADKRD